MSSALSRELSLKLKTKHGTEARAYEKVSLGHMPGRKGRLRFQRDNEDDDDAIDAISKQDFALRD